MTEPTVRAWRPCSNCKKPIPLGARYWVCSVSTCNRERTGLVFCSVDCWDAHVPLLRHKDAWSEERTAPSEPRQVLLGPASAKAPATARDRSPSSGADARLQPAPDDEILVVVSKVKAYIRARSGLSTSDAAMAVLSDHVRALCDAAIRSAWQHERKTVLDRDLPRS